MSNQAVEKVGTRRVSIHMASGHVFVYNLTADKCREVKQMMIDGSNAIIIGEKLINRSNIEWIELEN